MRVRLADSVLERPVDLMLLVGVCAQRDHGLAASPAARDRALGRWGDLASPLAEVMDALAVRFVHLPAACPLVTVDVGGQSDWRTLDLSVEDALLFLNTPLDLLVENERADGAFVRRLANAYQRRLFDEALKRGALRLRQGGGITEVKKAVEDLQAASHFPGQERLRRVQRLRTFVIYDRDAKAGDATQPHEEAVKLRARLGAAQPGDPGPIGHHQLRRRHMESYVPTAQLQAWMDGAAGTGVKGGPRGLVKTRAERILQWRADPLLRLCADSLNMKKGLLVGPHKDVLRSNWSGPPASQAQSARPADRLALEAAVAAVKPDRKSVV